MQGSTLCDRGGATSGVTLHSKERDRGYGNQHEGCMQETMLHDRCCVEGMMLHCSDYYSTYGAARHLCLERPCWKIGPQMRGLLIRGRG